MFHQMLAAWFNFVQEWGYVGVFLLMALESSIVPIPSEIVMPPAAYWASQGRMDFWLVILAGTAGSYFGSILNYAVARGVGAPVVNKYGKYFLMGPEKVRIAEGFVSRFGAFGVFLARLLPVVRHLISIPAGILKMNVSKFSVATTVGAFIWCAILSWFGREVIGSRPDLLSSPQALIEVCREKLAWFVIAAVLLTLAYGIVVIFKRRDTMAV